jgi:transposase-like protein
LGDGAALSPAAIERLRGTWQADHDTWTARDLHDRDLVYVWADGVYVKAGLEKDKAAVLVVIGAMADGTKEVLAVTPGFRESTAAWTAQRGPSCQD